VGRLRQGVYFSGLIVATVLGFMWRAGPAPAPPVQAVTALSAPSGRINPAAHARVTCSGPKPFRVDLSPHRSTYLSRPTASAGAVFRSFLEHELPGIPVSHFETSSADEQIVRYVLGHSNRTHLVVTLARADGRSAGWNVVGVTRCVSLIEYRARDTIGW
jgi:hypothetical protein